MSGGPSCSWLLEGKTRAGTFLGPLLAPCLGHFEEVMMCSESWFVTDSFLRFQIALLISEAGHPLYHLVCICGLKVTVLHSF